MGQITKSIIVKGDVAQIYGLWANPENFPRFMKYIRSVESTGPITSHWVMNGPLGLKVDWNAEMTRMELNQRIAWNSKDADGLVTTSGQVLFRSLPKDEVEVTVTVKFSPPAGKAGEALAKLLANPEERLEEDLRNFKAYVESMPSHSTVGRR
jgi:uncharacterized membrane protein